jgi:hypothetical protein
MKPYCAVFGDGVLAEFRPLGGIGYSRVQSAEFIH